jgi:hypothetical protein
MHTCMHAYLSAVSGRTPRYTSVGGETCQKRGPEYVQRELPGDLC